MAIQWVLSLIDCSSLGIFIYLFFRNSWHNPHFLSKGGKNACHGKGRIYTIPTGLHPFPNGGSLGKRICWCVLLTIFEKYI